MVKGIIGVSRVRGVDVHEILASRREGLEQLIVDVVGNERCGELSEVLLERGGDGVDVEVRVGDIKVVTAFKAFFDSLNLGVTTRFAVDAFDIHA